MVVGLSSGSAVWVSSGLAPRESLWRLCWCCPAGAAIAMAIPVMAMAVPAAATKRSTS